MSSPAEVEAENERLAASLADVASRIDRYRAALAEISRSFGAGERCQWCDRIDHTDECPVERAAQALEAK